MKNICIIGGGIAGLAAAVYLCKHHKVFLFEATEHFGGRAKSYYLENYKIFIDNGQHLLSAAYKNTIDFFNIINCSENFDFPSRLDINYLRAGGRKNILKIRTDSQISGFWGILNSPFLRISERVRLLSGMNSIRHIDEKNIKTTKLKKFLEDLNQNAELIKNFWEVLAISVFNSSIEEINTEDYVEVVKKLFFDKENKSVLIFPKSDLLNAYIKPAMNFIKSNGGEIFNKSRARKFIVTDNRINSIVINEREFFFDDYIIAVPSNQLFKILEISRLKLESEINEIRYNPILSVNMVTNRFNLGGNFFYLMDSVIQWIFQKKGYLSIVISNPGEIIKMEKVQIVKLIEKELKKYFDWFSPDLIDNYFIVKEKKATFISDNNSFKLRPEQKTQYDNLFIAGDFTKTGLPSTIESAVLSAKICSDLLLKKY